MRFKIERKCAPKDFESVRLNGVCRCLLRARAYSAFFILSPAIKWNIRRDFVPVSRPAFIARQKKMFPAASANSIQTVQGERSFRNRQFAQPPWECTV